MHYKQLEQLETDIKGIKAVYVDDMDNHDSLDELIAFANTYGYNLINNKDGFEQDAWMESVLAEQRMVNLSFGVLGGLVLLTILGLFRSEIAVRKRELAILSAIGMNRGQIFAVILSQGLTAGVLGVFAGSVIAVGLFLILPAHTVVMSKAQLIPWSTILTGALIGILAPVSAALLSMRAFKKISIRDIVQE